MSGQRRNESQQGDIDRNGFGGNPSRDLIDEVRRDAYWLHRANLPGILSLLAG
jgi:hypothetical protein